MEAEALYDNESEWPDELEFRRGDMLKVIDRNRGTDVADGWWVCEDVFHRRGIAPANRLALVNCDTMNRNTFQSPRRFQQPYQPYMSQSTMLFNDFDNDEDDLINNYISARRDRHQPRRMFDDTFGSMPSPSRFNDRGGPPDTLMTQSTRSGSRNIPIRIMRQDSAPHLAQSRPPPPPQRRYFQSDSQRATPTLSTADVTWRSDSNKSNGETKPQLHQAPMSSIFQPKTSSINSRSNNTNGFSSPQPQQQYHQPQVPYSQSSQVQYPPRVPPPPRTSDQTSVVMNVLEDLYETPRKPLPSLIMDTPPDSQHTDSTTSTPDIPVASIRGVHYGKPSHDRMPPPDPTHRKSSTEENKPKSALKTSPVIQTLAGTIGGKKSVSFGGPSTSTDEVVDSMARIDVKSTRNGQNGQNGQIGQNGQTAHNSATPFQKDFCEQVQTIEKIVTYLSSLSSNRHWRQPQVLQANLQDINVAVTDMCHKLNILIQTFNTAAKSRETEVITYPLRNSLAMLNSAKDQLNSTGWSLAALSRRHGEVAAGDALEQFVAVGKQVPSDMTRVTSYILDSPLKFYATGHKNGTVDSGVSSGSDSNSYANGVRPTATTAPTGSTNGGPFSNNGGPFANNGKGATSNSGGPFSNNGGPTSNNGTSNIVEEDELMSDAESIFDDYDFIDQRDKQAANKQKRQAQLNVIRDDENATPTLLRSASPRLAPTVTNGTSNTVNADTTLIKENIASVDANIANLSTAIEQFFSTVEQSANGPDQFIGKGKLVILSAHKLVCIGDGVAQKAKNSDTRTQLRDASDNLCGTLKTCVQATKLAAQHFPSMQHIQAMIESVLAISHSAHQMRVQLKQCSA